MEMKTMGSFDTMYDGDREIQVKCFRCHLDNIKKGDKVGDLHNYLKSYEPWDDEDQLDTYTIVMTPYADPRYALIKDRVFVGFVDSPRDTYPPYVARWGVSCDIDGYEVS